MTAYDLSHLEKTALAMTKKNWSDQASQDFDDAFRPAVALKLVGDLRTARRNEGHNREAWGKAEARLLSREHEIARLAARVAELERWWYAVPEDQRFAIMSDDAWKRHAAAAPTSGVIPTPAETGGDVSQEPKPDRMERSEPSPFPNPTADSGES